MRGSNRLAAIAAAALLAAVGAHAAAPDSAQIIKDRQATMKQQGAAMGKVKAFLEGKGDIAAAQKGGADLKETMDKIPSLFPPGTDTASPDGKYRPKPAIWSSWNEFLSVRDTAANKTQVLIAALDGGDKAKIQAAFGDLGKNGCGACHDKFREKLQ